MDHLVVNERLSELLKELDTLDGAQLDAILYLIYKIKARKRDEAEHFFAHLMKTKIAEK